MAPLKYKSSLPGLLASAYSCDEVTAAIVAARLTACMDAPKDPWKPSPVNGLLKLLKEAFPEPHHRLASTEEIFDHLGVPRE